jgi:hypothetical protein
VVEESDEFIRAYGKPHARGDSYAHPLRELRGSFHDIVEALECLDEQLEKDLEEIQRQLDSSPDKLEKVHPQFLAGIAKPCQVGQLPGPAQPGWTLTRIAFRARVTTDAFISLRFSCRSKAAGTFGQVMLPKGDGRQAENKHSSLFLLCNLPMCKK